MAGEGGEGRGGEERGPRRAGLGPGKIERQGSRLSPSQVIMGRLSRPGIVCLRSPGSGAGLGCRSLLARPGGPQVQPNPNLRLSCGIKLLLPLGRVSPHLPSVVLWLLYMPSTCLGMNLFHWECRMWSTCELHADGPSLSEQTALTSCEFLCWC